MALSNTAKTVKMLTAATIRSTPTDHVTASRMNRAVAESSRCNLIDCRTRRLLAEQDSGKLLDWNPSDLSGAYESFEWSSPGRADARLITDVAHSIVR